VARPPNRNEGEEGAAHRTGMIAGIGLVRASWRRPTHERIERLCV
jgi:hypothetical protein